MHSSTSSSETGAPPAGSARWPAAALAAVVVFLACEQAVWRSPAWLRFCARYAPPGAGDPLITTARIRLLPERVAAPPVLLLGSSQVREGLSCAAFEAALPGHPCANLAVGGGSPLDVLYVSRRTAARWPRRVVVTGVFPKVLHMAPKAAFADPATVGCLLRGGAWRRMDAVAWLDVAYGLLGNASETLRDREALRALADAVGGDWRRAWRLERPAQPDRLLAGEPPRPDRYFDTRVGVVDFDTRPGTFTAVQEEALETVIRQETAAGNVVVIVDFPTRPGYETTLPPETVIHYRQFRERLERRADITLVRPEHLPPLAAGDFLDFTHLSSEGRDKVSRRIAEIVAALGGAEPVSPR
jgi:hypothetical protein